MLILFDVRGHAFCTREALAVLRQNLRLLLILAKKEIVEPYAGQFFGRFWAFGHPLFLMAVYAFVFGVVFKARIGGTYEMPLDYTTYVLSGLVPWFTFQQAMARGATAISANASLVKQIVFPVEVLPAKTVLATLVVLVVGLAFIVIYTLISARTAYFSYLLLPVLVVIQIIAMIGMGYGLAALSVFVPDVREFIQMFSVINIFIMPAIYLPEWIPTIFKPIIYLNPFSYMVWCYQDVLYFGRFGHPLAWVIFGLISLLTFAVGYRTFRKLKPMFGNVL